MEIMSIRLRMLEDALAGLEQTGVSLVALRDGKLYSAGFSDDPGMYLVIPQLAKSFGLSIGETLDMFYYVLIGCSFMIALSGLLVLYRKMRERVVAVLGLIVVGALVLRTGDVYSFAPCLAAC